MAIPIGTRRLHWRYALLTASRLRKTGGIVENDVLEALKITLHPPSSPAEESSDIIGTVRSFMSEDDEPRIRGEYNEDTRKNATSSTTAGLWNCKFLLRAYEDMSYRGNIASLRSQE